MVSQGSREWEVQTSSLGGKWAVSNEVLTCVGYPFKFPEFPDNGILRSLKGSEEDRLQLPGERGSSGCRRRLVASGLILEQMRRAGASSAIDTAGRQCCCQSWGLGQAECLLSVLFRK